MPREHRLAGRKALTLGDLAEERFVVVPRSSSSPAMARSTSCARRLASSRTSAGEVLSDLQVVHTKRFRSALAAFHADALGWKENEVVDPGLLSGMRIGWLGD